MGNGGSQSATLSAPEIPGYSGARLRSSGVPVDDGQAEGRPLCREPAGRVPQIIFELHRIAGLGSGVARSPVVEDDAVVIGQRWTVDRGHERIRHLTAVRADAVGEIREDGLRVGIDGTDRVGPDSRSARYFRAPVAGREGASLRLRDGIASEGPRERVDSTVFTRPFRSISRCSRSSGTNTARTSPGSAGA